MERDPIRDFREGSGPPPPFSDAFFLPVAVMLVMDILLLEELL
jgi:hypothetical protein